MNNTNKITLLLLSLVLFVACKDNNLPKPPGYFRIDLPEKNYHYIDSLPFPFGFDLPQYAKVNLERTKTDNNFLNIDFPEFGARIHMSYLTVDSNIVSLFEDSRTLVYKHVVKAQDIAESIVLNNKKRVFGTYYQIEGNAASGSQFYLTDSTDHFLRGALYFNIEPNYDSIAPVQNFIKEDIERLIDSFNWK